MMRRYLRWKNTSRTLGKVFVNLDYVVMKYVVKTDFRLLYSYGYLSM